MQRLPVPTFEGHIFCAVCWAYRKEATAESGWEADQRTDHDLLARNCNHLADQLAKLSGCPANSVAELIARCNIWDLQRICLRGAVRDLNWANESLCASRKLHWERMRATRYSLSALLALWLGLSWQRLQGLPSQEWMAELGGAESLEGPLGWPKLHVRIDELCHSTSRAQERLRNSAAVQRVVPSAFKRFGETMVALLDGLGGPLEGATPQDLCRRFFPHPAQPLPAHIGGASLGQPSKQAREITGPTSTSSTPKPTKAQAKAAAALRSLLASPATSRAQAAETTARVSALLHRLPGLSDGAEEAQPSPSPRAFLSELRRWLAEAELRLATDLELLRFAKGRLPEESKKLARRGDEENVPPVDKRPTEPEVKSCPPRQPDASASSERRLTSHLVSQVFSPPSDQELAPGSSASAPADTSAGLGSRQALPEEEPPSFRHRPLAPRLAHVARRLREQRERSTW